MLELIRIECDRKKELNGSAVHGQTARDGVCPQAPGAPLCVVFFVWRSRPPPLGVDVDIVFAHIERPSVTAEQDPHC
ncbi:hypothetical protein Bpfe_018375 [Biomphalaria pfeifferi]|uniref:Uncharacterized protein n=1 Tax=Biomphalaria pfeifferi TaxID=112525 RepID=A0AAD8F5B0_BIOPF|nr:hypothetical protein Bpfe_018375 [Biomphalaria pfeifferi]